MISVERAQSTLATLFLVMVFSFPRTLQSPKIIVLFILLLLMAFRPKLGAAYLNFFLSYLFIFISPFLVAGIRGNETIFVLHSFLIYFIFPFLVTIVLQVFDRNRLFSIIYRSAFISLVLITLTAVSTLLHGVGIFPINLNAIFYPDENRIGLNEGFIHIINSPLTYYLFLIPIIFNQGKQLNFRNWKLYLFLSLLIFSVLTGRRILLVPFILVILINFKYYVRYISLFLVALMFIIPKQKFENFEFEKVVSRFRDAARSSGDSEVRSEQGTYFTKYILDRPLAGYGMGAYMPDYLRNNEFKTAYENSFHYLIFCVGVPIAFILICMYLYLLYRNWKLEVDNSLNVGICLGILSVLLASFTNPYWLSSFDYTVPFGVLITLAFKRTI
ncbi:hypothetical protein [Sphingobacterium sp. SYP-B4668]|uniref:hypothetical protein n=1 Tax=Sphingobacterium sp. SYP-B4668 TaxID=2996035 RepID=UPI0022DE6E6D|nr:hypothetical protein [Sphingobacterium sp. SYP-B4668]